MKMHPRNDDYVFTGHIHFYHREEVGKCVFLLPGCRGATIRRKNVDPHFHSVGITVCPNGITEKLYSLHAQTLFKDDEVQYYITPVQYKLKFPILDGLSA